MAKYIFLNREKVMFLSKLSTGSAAQWHKGSMRRCQLKMRTEVMGHCAHASAPHHPCCRGGPGYKPLSATFQRGQGTIVHLQHQEDIRASVARRQGPSPLGSSLLQGCHWYLSEHQMRCFLLICQNTWLSSKQCHSPVFWWQLAESSVFDLIEKRLCLCFMYLIG